MTPNPVCYNGVSLPNLAIHVGHVSLGITPKDYRADTARNWRSGISPNGAVVLYSNTYDLGLELDPALAEPRIWWTQPTGSVNDYKLKITELLSRLPERASVNYEVFSTYDDAIDWLHNSAGKYSLVNDNYPEYFIDGRACLFNIETGLLASYPASGSHIHTLANPNVTVGNSLNSRALSWHGFTLTNVIGDLNIDKIGAEPGLSFESTGHIISIDDLAGNTYNNRNIVLEMICDIDFEDDATVLSLIDSSSNSEVLRLDWESGNQRFSAHYPQLGSIIDFEIITTPWTDHIHLTVSIPGWKSSVANENSSVRVNGDSYGIFNIAGSNFEWTNSTYIQLGNNRSLSKPVRRLYSAKMYSIESSAAGGLVETIVNTNVPIFNDLYF